MLTLAGIPLQDSGKTETVTELSKTLGWPLYSFNCTTLLNRAMMVDIFKGLASSGESGVVLASVDSW